MIKAIIFDLDNTLVDFMDFKSRAVDAAIDAMIDAGMHLTKPEAKEKIQNIYDLEGIEYQRVFDRFLQELYGKIDYRMISAAIFAYRKEREAALRPYPKVFPTLIELIKMGMKLAVVSDAPAKEAWLRLSYEKLQYFFDVVVTFEDTKERKPSPKPFNLCLERLGLKAEECLMIGDWAERDVVGAKSVGMKTVFARYGDNFNTKHPGSDYDINLISELINIVKKENNLI